MGGGRGGGQCDIIFNITGGVRTNFFCFGGGGVLSKFLLDNSSFSASPPPPPDNYCTVPNAECCGKKSRGRISGKICQVTVFLQSI